MSIKSSLIVLTMFALSPLALAQSDAASQTGQDQQQQTEQQMPEPDTGSVTTNQHPAPSTTTTQDAESTTAGQSPTQSDEPSAKSAEQPAKALDDQIVLQSESTILSHDIVGAPVYSPNDEQIGDINDLIINLDGTVDGVVIGVGGFLGLGEKDVAVEMNALAVTPLEDGSVQLVLNATREDLENAPSFKSASQQKIDQEIESARQQQINKSNDNNMVPKPLATDNNQ